MKKDNVTNMYEHSNSSKVWTVEQMLDEAKKEAIENPNVQKAIVILVDKTEDGIALDILNAQMLDSEMVGYLTKAQLHVAGGMVD